MLVRSSSGTAGSIVASACAARGAFGFGPAHLTRSGSRLFEVVRRIVIVGESVDFRDSDCPAPLH
jgi:hypothetical protein